MSLHSVNPPRPALQGGIVILLLTVSFVQVGVTKFLITDRGRRQTWETITTMHQQVLENRAGAFYQYQMWIFANVVEFAKNHILAKSPLVIPEPINLIFLYDALYFVGNTIFLILLFRWLLRFAAPPFALLAVLTFTGIQSLLWYDNSLHPGDPFGLILATLLVEAIYDCRDDFKTLLLSLASGFIWEKHFFFPLIYLAYRLRKRDGRTAHLLSFAALLGITAVAGQVFYRIYFGLRLGLLTSGGTTLEENLSLLGLGRFALGYAILTGMPLISAILYGGKLDRFHVAVLIPLVVFPFLYIAMNGTLGEMRGYVVLIPLIYPAFTLGLSHWLGQEPAKEQHG